MPASSDLPADSRGPASPGKAARDTEAARSGDSVAGRDPAPRAHAEGGSAPASGEHAVVTVRLPAGVALHARPAADLVRTASRLPAPVTIAANDKRANARSILDVLALGATGGTELTLTATGPGAAEAVQALAEVVANLGT